MSSSDVVVVGSGHNALITAAYLARAGWRVLVLEGNDRPGGLVRTEELTRPGFLHDTYATAHPLLVSGPAYAALGPELSELGLHYLNTRYPTGVSFPDGATAVLSTDAGENQAEAERLAPGDGTALARLLKDFEPLMGPVFGLLAADLSTPSSAKVIHDLMHSPDGGYSEFAHLFTLSARDLLEQLFRSPVLQGMLAPWVVHLGRGPDEANSGLWIILVLLALTMGGMPIPAGGSERLAHALTALIKRHGGQVECHQWVDRILVEHGRAVGVVTAEGEVFSATRAVVASVNPDQLYLKLLAHEQGVVPPLIRKQARGFRYGRGCVQIHLALAEPVRFADERLTHVGQLHLAGGLNATSRALNEALRGLLPAAPTISFDTPSALDPSRCPPGRAVARLQMLDVPCHPHDDAGGQIAVGSDGWTEDVKNAFADRVIDLAAQHLPTLPDTILDRFVIGPDDLARFNPNCGPGDPYGGSHDLSQSYLFRPLPGQPSYRTVVPNLYMVGAATWPGHGINGGSGHIVANQLLAGHGDRGKSRDGSVLPAARLTTAAEDLRGVLEKPLFNPVLNILVGEGKLDYEVYLRTTDLLSLQTPSGKLSDPDELMFQIVHQAQEVWLKLLAHELTEVVSSLDTDALWDVTARLDRAVRITHCLAEELRVLETLTPDTYQLIRRNLGNGSGQESPGYNAVRTAAPYVAAALDRLLARAGVQVEDVYVPALTSTAGLKRVCELLLDFDERFQQWLVTHFMLVRRTIGAGRDTKALDGLSVRILLGRTTHPLFDSLWRARDTMTANWRREGGHRPGATRGAESS